MCGIAAIINPNRLKEADRHELARITDAMYARGPDGSGQWISSCNCVGLAHRRLAIIDPDNRSGQPMRSDSRRFIATFNGEIYNYKELKYQLEFEGHTFYTNSDTEVLLNAFEEWGLDCLERLKGMYAFAVWDDLKGEVILARDPYGIKPLYYSLQDGILRVASQVKALISGGRISREPDKEAIQQFFAFGSVPEPRTIYKGIHALGAGQCLTVTRKGKTQGPIYHNDIRGNYTQKCVINESERLESLVETAVSESVRRHMIADVPVGVFLSAGLDSTTLAALMHEFDQHKLQSVTLAFDEFRGTEWDEVPLAEAVANKLGTSHSTRYITSHEFAEDLPYILADMDQPTVDGINTWYVSKVASEAGLKVAVSGVGGDELFGGYKSFSQVPKIAASVKFANNFPGFRQAVEKGFPLASGLFPGVKLPVKAQGISRYGASLAGAYYLKKAQFLPSEIDSLLKPEFRDGEGGGMDPTPLVAGHDPGPGSYDWVRLACLESVFYMRNQLLRDSDWAGMAHSLEIRTPLVDSELSRTLVPRLSRLKNPPGKGLMVKAAEAKLPDEVLGRKKSGFQVPIGKWVSELNLDPLPSGIDWRGHWGRAWAYRLVAMHPDLKDVLV